MPEELALEPTPEELMLQQAREAIRQEKFSQAREILTNLVRSDQQNPDYWVWMSAAMETQKERLYCLQTAYKMDPTNTAARRGLVLLGALPPDDSIQPFPMNHPSPWESKLKLTEDRDKPSAFKKLSASPAVRLGAGIGAGLFVVIGGLIGLGILTNRPAAIPALGGTSRPTVTAYATNSNLVDMPATAIHPLSELLSIPYTPTPIYAATPHGEAASDSYKGALRAYRSGQWDNVIIMMGQVATAQPGSADAVYFIGEANRLSGKFQDAVDSYNSAISVNANFAPSYLGKARANLAINPKKNVIDDLNKAIQLDPNYSEAYMQRGLYYLGRKDYKAAQSDLEQAASLNDSPLVEINLARILLAQNENEAALEAAKKANQLDITMLEGYLVLGMAYRANGELDQAVSVLETYLKYQPDNSEAFTMLGAAYYNHGDFTTAKKDLEKAIRLDSNSSTANFWLAQTLMAQDDYDNALISYRDALQLDPESFDAGEGIAKAYMAKGEFNNSYSAINKMEKLTKDDPVFRARFVYIRAQSLEQINLPDLAYKDWTEILSMPTEATTEEMRQLASKRIAELNTKTPTMTVTKTPTATIPPVTVKPSRTTIPSATRVPTSTPSPTKTPIK